MTATATTETTTAAVTVPRAEIARALRAASSIKSKFVRLDLHEDGVKIIGGTGAVGVRVWLSDVQGWPSASAIVNRAQLANLLPYITGDVEMSATEHALKLETGGDVFEVRRWREDVFPERDFDSSAAVIFARYDAPTLREVLGRVLPFASRDETRPMLANVALYPDANCAAATDSYRLAVIGYGDMTGEPKRPPVLLHVDAAQSIRQLLAKQLGEVVISATPEFTFVTFDDVTWSIERTDVAAKPYTKLDGTKVTPTRPQYPSWWTLFPDAFDAEIKVDREELLTTARAARAVGGKNPPMRLKATEREVRASIAGTDVGSMDRRLVTGETTGIEKIGPVFEIGLNPDFVAHVCAVAPVERLTLRVISPLRPVKIEAGRDQYLLMPIRLNV